MALTNEEAKELEMLLRLNGIEDSRDVLLKFTQTTFKKFKPQNFHIKFYEILNLFAHEKIKNLIVSMPPQHGKSEGSTRRLLSFIAGLRPEAKMALVCYAAKKAEKFGREIMSIMREQEYKDIFPNVEYPERGYTGTKSNTNTERESINSIGSMKFVGVMGPLTGDPVDVMAMDDLYKDWKEANSPLIQENVWDWYISVAESRLHNDSQQIITFTRWSDNDLIAKLIALGLVVMYDGSEPLNEVIEGLNDDQFLMINFPALKVGEPNEIDPREEGEALWPSKHSKKKLESTKAKDEDKFECLYQGDPQDKKGLLYTRKFKTYQNLPKFKMIKNYTDTADKGKDYLCSIVYGVPLDKNDEHLYVLDVLYTQAPMEVTEPKTAELFEKWKVKIARVESNNGGRGFARAVKKLVKGKWVMVIRWFHQGDNKEARIFSNSATVNNRLVFPEDWNVRWPKFWSHVTKYKKIFETNVHDDAPDCMTGIVETENRRIDTDDDDSTVSKADIGLF